MRPARRRDGTHEMGLARARRRHQEPRPTRFDGQSLPASRKICLCRYEQLLKGFALMRKDETAHASAFSGCLPSSICQAPPSFQSEASQRQPARSAWLHSVELPPPPKKLGAMAAPLRNFRPCRAGIWPSRLHDLPRKKSTLANLGKIQRQRRCSGKFSDLCLLCPPRFRTPYFSEPLISSPRNFRDSRPTATL